MKPELAHALTSATGIDFSRADARPVVGGCIHSCLEVRVGDGRYFLKHNARDALATFEAEAEGLAALAACDAFRVPRPVAWGATDGDAFLLLEYLELRPVTSAEDGRRFARALVALHRAGHGEAGRRFGWPRDNFIGGNPQLNGEEEGWAHFFATRRLAPQLRMARARGYGGALGSLADRLLERMRVLFVDYRPRPSLLHGDLWGGNAAMDGAGRPAIFDPAVYRGDREADLAMTELFGGFPAAFHAEYRAAWPLAAGYEQRKTLYNLYHVLNHLNLFGAGYLDQAERMVRALSE